MTLEEKGEKIIQDIEKETGVSPVRIFKNMAKKDYISMHGPEHHVLDGASLLVAYHNAGKAIDLDKSLDKLLKEGLRMPGAMCGLWGVCGAVTSIGAALAIIDETGPLSTDGTWGEHMSFTAKAIDALGSVNGPRCCKRDSHTAIQAAVRFTGEHFGIEMDSGQIVCTHVRMNNQCIGRRICQRSLRRRSRV